MKTIKKITNSVLTFALTVAVSAVMGFGLASAVLTEAECADIVAAFDAAVKWLFV